MLESHLISPHAQGSIEGDEPARPAVLSVAAEVPSARVTTAELAERLGVSEDWIVSRTGIRARPVAAPDERLSDFAARAGLEALNRAGASPADVDLVLVATLTQDELMPNAAPVVAHEVGAHGAGAIDLGAACTGFLSGLSLGAAQIETRRAECVLLIGADFTTRIVDWDDKRTAPLFGDGAGAVVLGPVTGEVGAIGPIVLGADGSGAPAIQIAHDDRKLRMDGPEVYRHAVARMGEATLAAVEGAGLTLDDIDLFVYHQANGRILRALAEKLHLPSERVVDCIENLGNSSAATLPLGLVAAEQDGLLKPGARVLLSAFGAGFTWGAGVIEWGGSDNG
ncbi:MAG TPA: beta-ketoacyl-ACP synthase III [Solirubrobacteraceae bacterium]|nr:beta-ketoacyl-ACP synthase III [Solirubrobacteraceae bacterium]